MLRNKAVVPRGAGTVGRVPHPAGGYLAYHRHTKEHLQQITNAAQCGRRCYVRKKIAQKHLRRETVLDALFYWEVFWQQLGGNYGAWLLTWYIRFVKIYKGNTAIGWQICIFTMMRHVSPDRLEDEAVFPTQSQENMSLCTTDQRSNGMGWSWN